MYPERWVKGLRIFIKYQDTQVFHDDLFPPALSGEAALTSAEWLEGKSSGTSRLNLCNLVRPQNDQLEYKQ